MSALRASAAEFVPSFASAPSTASNPAAVAGQQTVGPAAQQQDQQEQHVDDEQWQEEYYDDGYYDEQGNWVYYEAEALEAEAASQPWQDAQQQDLPNDPWAAAQSSKGDASEPSEDWGQLGVTTEQAVGLMHAWYPTHSKPMLQQLFEACHYQLQDTLNILAEMEAEQSASMKESCSSSSTGHSGPAGGAAAPTQRSRPKAQQVQDWPSLAVAAAAANDQKPANSTENNSSSSTWATVAKKAAFSAATAAGPSASPAGNASRPKQQQAYSSSQSEANHVPWVTTGTAVSQEYAEARAEASDYARVRNACFHQATIAYLAGNKALAKELSAKGKEAAQKMWEAHQRASQQIFTQRNDAIAKANPTAQRAAYSSAGVIDLHGLHVREVQAELPRQLQALAAQKQQSVNVIVGVGKHTKGPPGPRLMPAVEAVLQQLGYKYRQPQPGLLRVELR